MANSIFVVNRLVAIRIPTLYIVRTNSNASSNARKSDSEKAEKKSNAEFYKSLSPESRAMLDRMLRVDHAG
jgi:demethoxyubiquinone hydroxylase (CLK1/Coq7/Cat5 family)